jgi:hypothetical protein
MSDSQRTSDVWSKYRGLSKNARIALGVTLILGGLIGEFYNIIIGAYD